MKKILALTMCGLFLASGAAFAKTEAKHEAKAHTAVAKKKEVKKAAPAKVKAHKGAKKAAK